jgi:hypothetical protein
MRVTIIESPEGDINGMNAEQWQVGQIYDLSPGVASVLIVEGYAVLEMRAEGTGGMYHATTNQTGAARYRIATRAEARNRTGFGLQSSAFRRQATGFTQQFELRPFARGTALGDGP